MCFSAMLSPLTLQTNVSGVNMCGFILNTSFRPRRWDNARFRLSVQSEQPLLRTQFLIPGVLSLRRKRVSLNAFSNGGTSRGAESVALRLIFDKGRGISPLKIMGDRNHSDGAHDERARLARQIQNVSHAAPFPSESYANNGNRLQKESSPSPFAFSTQVTRRTERHRESQESLSYQARHSRWQIAVLARAEHRARSRRSVMLITENTDQAINRMNDTRNRQLILLWSYHDCHPSV